MSQLSTIRCCATILTTLTLCPCAFATPIGSGVFAQANLNISDFKLGPNSVFDPTFDRPRTTFTALGESTSNFDGLADSLSTSVGFAVPFLLEASSDPFYAANIENGVIPSISYSGSRSTLSPDPFFEGLSGIVDSTVSLHPNFAPRVGTATAFWSTNYFFELEETASIDLSFNATTFIRTLLSQDLDLAVVSIDWTFEISSANGPIVRWSPNGHIEAGDCFGPCTEIEDGFNLTRSLQSRLATDQIETNSGTFAIQFTLDPGEYATTVTASAKADARADIASIPEPSTLALLATGLPWFLVLRGRLVSAPATPSFRRIRPAG